MPIKIFFCENESLIFIQNAMSIVSRIYATYISRTQEWLLSGFRVCARHNTRIEIHISLVQQCGKKNSYVSCVYFTDLLLLNFAGACFLEETDVAPPPADPAPPLVLGAFIVCNGSIFDPLMGNTEGNDPIIVWRPH
jgi:hypothetical protein